MLNYGNIMKLGTQNKEFKIIQKPTKLTIESSLGWVQFLLSCTIKKFL